MTVILWSSLLTFLLLLGCSVVPDSLQNTRTVALQASLTMGFPRQQYWRGWPFPSPILSLLLLSHFSCVRLCATPSLGFSRQEHWSGLPFPSPVHKGEKWKWSRSVMSDSLRPHGLQSTRLLRPWDFPGKRTGVGCHYLYLLLISPLSAFSKTTIFEDWISLLVDFSTVNACYLLWLFNKII